MDATVLPVRKEFETADDAGNKIFALFLIVGIAVSCLSAQAVEKPSSKPGTTRFGSGFFITTNGFFVSNYHVVRLAKDISVKIGEQVYPARLAKFDSVNDIAILKVEGTFQCLPVTDTRKTALGDRLLTIGFPNPDVQGLAPKLTKGEVSALSGIQDDPRLFQISVPIQPGNSGGPLIDGNGNVIGITTSTLDALGMLLAGSDIPQNVNYAIKSDYLLALAGTIQELRLAMPSSKTASQDEKNIVASATGAVGMILVNLHKKAERSPASHTDNLSDVVVGPVMKGLRKLRVTISVPADKMLELQIQTDVEIKLRKVGLTIDDNAGVNLLVAVILMELGPSDGILGKYGTVRVTLRDMVTLNRAPAIETVAEIWSGKQFYFHGPLDTMSKRAREFASDLTDEFVNEFLKQNQGE